MRITGGRLRGRRLASFKDLHIRPTSDRVREAIFDLIGHERSGEKVLDLFAGTGILGIEALSRGAAFGLFLDVSPNALALIRKNLQLCRLEAEGLVVGRDLMRGLPRSYPVPGEKMDLVFIDPPYRKGMIPPVLLEILDRNILGSDAILVAQSEHREALPPRVKNLQQVQSRTYGETRITIYHHEANP